MNFKNPINYQPMDSSEIDAQEKLYEFKKYICAERVPEALSAVQKTLFFDQIYILVVKNNQKLTTFPCKIDYIENKKMMLAPSLSDQLRELGYIYINQNSLVEQEIAEIINRAGTKELILQPIYSCIDSLSFLCCTRNFTNSHELSVSEMRIIENVSIMVGESLDRMYFQFLNQKSFA